MSSLKISENERYIKTLDSLILKYIANINSNITDVQPTWNDARKEYFEFVVVTEQEPNQNDDTECETCNLCDVEVIFLDEHHNSEKHKLFVKLTQSVLERAAKSMETCLSVNKKNIRNDIYYCAPCSVAVLKDNKLIHERSKQHLNSQKYHENMSSLIQIYINKDNGGINLENYKAPGYLKNDDETNLGVDNGTASLTNDHKINLTVDNDTGNLTNDQKINFKIDNGTENLTNDHKINLTVDNDTGNLTNDHKIQLKVYNYTDNLTNNSEVELKMNNAASASYKSLESINTKNSTAPPKPFKKTYSKPFYKCNDTNDTTGYSRHSQFKFNTRIIHGKTSDIYTASDSNYEGQYSKNYISIGTDPKHVNCNLCEVKIPNTEKNINEHLKARKHVENVSKTNTFIFYNNGYSNKH